MMARTITLRYDARCRECGAHLPAGTEARYYKRGFIYGLKCHPKRPRTRRKSWRRDGLNPPSQRKDGAITLHEGPDGVWTTDDHSNVVTHYE